MNPGKRIFLLVFAVVVCGFPEAYAAPAAYDVILRGGMIYDGSGGQPYTGDVALEGDLIAVLGDIGDATAPTEIDVRGLAVAPGLGLAVAPGFVNMMSWANESLIEDGRSQSDIRQGVTLEIMGEGDSMGPLNDAKVIFTTTSSGQRSRNTSNFLSDAVSLPTWRPSSAPPRRVPT